MAKQDIDIEKLLEWAYRAQCVDRVIGMANGSISDSERLDYGTPAPWPATAEAIQTYGCRIDSASATERALGAKVPADAEAIHQRVMALGEWFLDDAANAWDREAAAAIGFTIDRDKSGHWLRAPDGQGTPLTPVVLPVLVILHARNGDQPDWCPWWRNPGAAVAKDDGEFDRWGRRRKSAALLTPETVLYRRAEYRLWHAALMFLTVMLEGQLEDYEAKSPAALAEPWVKKARNAA